MGTKFTTLSIYILIVAYLFLNFSCNYTKHIQSSQYLVWNNEVHIKSNKPIKNKGEFSELVMTNIIQKPNSGMFDVSMLPRWKLIRYNWNYQKFKNNPEHERIKKRKVEPPVILDTLLVEQSKINIHQYLFNQGYIYNTVSDTIIYHTKENSAGKAIIKYNIQLGKNYLINKINYECQYPEILALLETNKKNSPIQKGLPYSNIALGTERERMYKIIRNEGYYDFKQDNIFFGADTSNKESIKNLLANPFEQIGLFNTTPKQNESVDVTMRIKKGKDSTYGVRYKIRNVIVSLNEKKNTEEDDAPLTEVRYENIIYRYTQLPVNKNVIARNIFIHQGDYYSTKNVEETINRLNALGVFQFTTIRFEKNDSSNKTLDCIIKVNTAKKQDINLDVDVNTGENYKIGTGIGATYRNKNLFYGANQFLFRATYTTEFNYTKDDSVNFFKRFSLRSNNYNLATNITFPKFILPFKQNLFSKRNLPNTILGISYNRINRVGNFTIANITGTFGYNWRETEYKNWRVNPLFLTVVRVPEHALSDTFKARRATIPYYRNLFKNYIILGENLSYEYRDQGLNQKPHYNSLKIGFEEAGTLLKGINLGYQALTKDTINPIAQYTKLDVDYRYYYNKPFYSWINRIMIGIGVPLGKNNSSLPYIKQYASGGPFSNRGWRARYLGPGHYIDSTQTSSNTKNFIDRTGDLKLEGNSEVRFGLLKLFSGAIHLKGAAFLDAGNVWIYKKDPTLKGGELNIKYFWQDIALSGGIGFRLDFTFFVARVDVGYPFKQPYIMQHQGWNFKNIHLNSGVWNIALGYPF